MKRVFLLRGKNRGNGITQRVQHLSHKFEDMYLITRTPVQKPDVLAYSTSTNEDRQVHPWDPGAQQHSLFSKHQASERLCLKTQGTASHLLRWTHDMYVQT